MLSELVERSLSTLTDLAEKYSKAVWEVGFSGGKDSTLLLHLLVEFLEDRLNRPKAKLPKAIYVVHEDTLLEPPPLRQYTRKVLTDLIAYSYEVLGGLLKVKIVRPSEGEDFFSMMIDRGYPAPHYRFRWCVRVLKVKPMRTFLSKLIAKGKVIMLTGLRIDESHFRSHVIRRRAGKQNHQLLKVAPLLNWRKEHVFAFLRQAKQPWNGHDYSLLLRIYGQPKQKGTQQDQNVRFGCWTCTVVKHEKALYKLGTSIWPKALVLAEAKEDIRAISRNPVFRTKGRGKWQLGRLNELGRLAVTAILARVLVKAPEGLAAYLESQELRARLVRWLSRLVDRARPLRGLLPVDPSLAHEALAIVEYFSSDDQDMRLISSITL